LFNAYKYFEVPTGIDLLVARAIEIPEVGNSFNTYMVNNPRGLHCIQSA
jgi:hypothetical protein